MSLIRVNNVRILEAKLVEAVATVHIPQYRHYILILYVIAHLFRNRHVLEMLQQVQPDILMLFNLSY